MKCSKCGEGIQITKSAYLIKITSLKGEEMGLKDVRLCIKCATKLKDYCLVDDDFSQVIERRKRGDSLEKSVTELSLNLDIIRIKYRQFLDQKLLDLSPGTIGKIGALKKASWSVEKIVDEIQPELRFLRCDNCLGFDLVGRIIRRKVWEHIHEQDYVDGPVD